MDGLRQWLCGTGSAASSFICHGLSPRACFLQLPLSHVISSVHSSLPVLPLPSTHEYREALDLPKQMQPSNLDFQHLEWKEPTKPLFFMSPMRKYCIIVNRHWTNMEDSGFICCIVYVCIIHIEPAMFYNVPSGEYSLRWNKSSLIPSRHIPEFSNWSSIWSKHSERRNTIHRGKQTIRE